MRADAPPPLPAPRGPLSSALFSAWRRDDRSVRLAPPVGDGLTGEDLHLALYACYELHYRGFDSVDDRWERHPEVVRITDLLEDIFESALRDEAGPCPVLPAGVHAALRDLATSSGGPSLSAFVAEEADAEQVRELAIHRSLYQRKEADPHSWAIPRLSGRAKAALIEIQRDEYGEGRPGASHAELFGDTMEALGLDPTYGAYLDVVPATTLATVNLISLLGRQRRLRGALVGHLALFEMTSVGPMGRYAAGMRRLGLDGAAPFYDIHVEADAHHEVVAGRDLAQGLADDEPALAGDLLFGARALMAVEGRFTAMLLDAWDRGESSLRPGAASTMAAHGRVGTANGPKPATRTDPKERPARVARRDPGVDGAKRRAVPARAFGRL